MGSQLTSDAPSRGHDLKRCRHRNERLARKMPPRGGMTRNSHSSKIVGARFSMPPHGGMT